MLDIPLGAVRSSELNPWLSENASTPAATREAGLAVFFQGCLNIRLDYTWNITNALENLVQTLQDGNTGRVESKSCWSARLG